MIKISSLLLLLLLLCTFISSEVSASRAKKKEKKRNTKLLGALFESIQKDDTIAVNDALTANPDLLNEKGGGGQTPLMASVLMGATKCAEYFLSLGADTSIGEKDGYTPMHGAGFQGRAEAAKLLLKEGISATDRHKDGYTPVHRAAWGRESRHTDTMQVFIDAGIEVCGLESTDGKTPLQVTPNPRTRSLLENFCREDGSGNKNRELRSLVADDDDDSQKSSQGAQGMKTVEIVEERDEQNGNVKKQRLRKKNSRTGKGGRYGMGGKKTRKKSRGKERFAAPRGSRKVSDDDDD